MASRPVIITSNANHGRDATITYSFTTSSGDSDMEAFELGINHQTLELERTRLSGPVFTFSLLESIGLELHQNHDGSISHDCGCQMHQAEGICKDVYWALDQIFREHIAAGTTAANGQVFSDGNVVFARLNGVLININALNGNRRRILEQRTAEHRPIEIRWKNESDKIQRQITETMLWHAEQKMFEHAAQNMRERDGSYINHGVLSVGGNRPRTTDQAHDLLTRHATDLLVLFRACIEAMGVPATAHPRIMNKTTSIYLSMMKSVVLQVSGIGRVSLRAVAARALRDQNGDGHFWHVIGHYFEFLKRCLGQVSDEQGAELLDIKQFVKDTMKLEPNQSADLALWNELSGIASEWGFET